MQSRPLLEQFSTFAHLSGDRIQGWITDPRLKKSMVYQLSQTSEASVSITFWAIYWHRHWQAKSHHQAEQHLVAHLQEPCYWVTQEILRKVGGLQHQSSARYTATDYFQITMAAVPLVLEKFDREKSSSLQAFSQIFLSNRIKSILRQQGQADFCSLWGLLKKTSRKRLLEVLKQQGFKHNQGEQYRLLWMGFQSLYVPVPPSLGKRPEPNSDFWEAIAQFYNGQRLGQLSYTAPRITATEVETRLRQLAQWIRNYNHPKLDSLNRPCFDEEGDDWQAQLADTEQRSLLGELIHQEEQDDRRQSQLEVQQQLIAAFGNLDSQSQQILCLLYGQGLSQQVMMNEVNLSQPTISRRLKKAKNHLLVTILQGTGSAAGLPVNNFPDPDQLKGITTALEEWLQVYLRLSDLCDSADHSEST